MWYTIFSSVEINLKNRTKQGTLHGALDTDLILGTGSRCSCRLQVLN